MGLCKSQSSTRAELAGSRPTLQDCDARLLSPPYAAWTLAPFVSRDGLTWKLLGDAKPIKAELDIRDLYLPNIHFEPCGGLYKWNGHYFVCGQNALGSWQPHQGRIIRMFRSTDFADWKPTNSIGFVRSNQHEYLGPGRSLEGEQTHEAISVWNRKNVLLGVYGQWHGAKEWKDISVDLGFVIANDGLNFREPAHDWRFLERGKDGEWDQGGLLQGQGFENIGDQSFLYYGAWDPRARGTARGGVGIATLPRDRFGELVVDNRGKGPGDYQTPYIVSELVTKSLDSSPNKTKRLFVNADGLGPKQLCLLNCSMRKRIRSRNSRANALPSFQDRDFKLRFFGAVKPMCVVCLQIIEFIFALMVAKIPVSD